MHSLEFLTIIPFDKRPVKEEENIPRLRTVTCANALMKTEESEIIQDDEETIIGRAENTYSNVGGKRVAVENLAEYIKHKSQKDLFKEFSVSTVNCC